MTNKFKVLMLSKSNGSVAGAIEEVSLDSLPEGDVVISVEYSTLNYKDGLILKGLGGLIQNYPHVPGVDCAGIVENSSNGDFAAGDRVVLNGWRFGEIRWGGYAQKARAHSRELVKLPENISTKNAMAIGTAGYTAMLAIMALEDNGLSPDLDGEVLVTGAAGGVGSIAVAVLANLGYNVVAATGRTELSDYFRSLGASNIISRTELEFPTKGPLSSERWIAAIDNVGGPILANTIASMKYHSNVATVGLAASSKLEMTVIPFIIRGVSLLGIDSVMCSMEKRLRAWKRLSNELPVNKLDEMVSIVSLSNITNYADDILEGRIKGRIVVDVNA